MFRNFASLSREKKTLVSFAFIALLLVSSITVVVTVSALSGTDVILGSGNDVFGGNLTVVGNVNASRFMFANGTEVGQQGPQGEQGIQGIQGEQGEQGET